jgi:hypothetical protein
MSWESESAPFRIAKSPVCVNDKGESIGEGIFANLDFGAGEQIAAIHRPILGSLDTERLLDTCANCYTWTEGSSTGTRLYVPEGTKVSKCAGCQRFRYCSKVVSRSDVHYEILICDRHAKRRLGIEATSTSARSSKLSLIKKYRKLCWHAWTC